jgi:hypothetical protein
MTTAGDAIAAMTVNRLARHRGGATATVLGRAGEAVP